MPAETNDGSQPRDFVSINPYRLPAKIFESLRGEVLHSTEEWSPSSQSTNTVAARPPVRRHRLSGPDRTSFRCRLIADRKHAMHEWRARLRKLAPVLAVTFGGNTILF